MKNCWGILLMSTVLILVIAGMAAATPPSDLRPISVRAQQSPPKASTDPTDAIVDSFPDRPGHTAEMETRRLENYKIALDLTPEESDWIRRHPRIRIGIDPEFSPFEFFSKDGRYQGMAADYVKIIGRSLGLSFEPVKGLNWKQVVAQAKQGKIDLLPCVGISSARKSYLIFSVPYLSFPRVIITRTEADIASMTDLAGKRVALQVNSSHHAFIQENTKIIPILYDRFREAMLALSKGEEDAVIGNLAVATDTIGKLNLTNLKIAAYTSKATTPLAFAGRKDLPLLIRLINKALAAIPEEMKIRISHKWLPGSRSLKLPDPLKMQPLTQGENDFLQNHRRIRIGIDPGYPPFEWIDADGRHQGISSDYVQLLEERLGISFQLIPNLTWPRILKGARKREIDVIACVSKTPDRDVFLRFTRPYLAFPIVIITRIRTPFISKIEDLSGKKVSVVNDYAPHESLQRHHPKIILSMADTPLEGLRQVSTGISEAYVGNLAVCTFLMQKHYITNLKIAAPADGIASTALAMGVRKDWPELTSILNKALNSISPQESNAIAAKWMSVRYEHAVDWSQVTRIVGTIIIAGILILGGFFYWNRKLSKEIIKRKEFEIKLEEAKLEAERANKAKSVFLANMSHEIRTPMNAVLGYSQLMRKDTALSDEHKKNINIINRSGEHLLNLINDILEMSKIEAGRLKLQPADFDLWNLLEDLEMMFQVQADAKRLEMNFYRSKTVPRYILADEAKLRQVLINLLGNAIKFTDNGDISLEVKARPAAESTVPWLKDPLDLIFEVRDTGVGMAPADLQNIFNSFEQTESGRHREGTGLGLSISKEYINFMGGDITVSSELARGSTFHFSIPTARGKAVDAGDNKPSPQIIGLESGQPSYRILVVDDKPANRDLLVQILTRVGFEIKSAADGRDAVALCRSWRPHLIMMDIRMPVMDGVEATMRIRADNNAKDVVIIAVSASALEEQRIDILKHGANAFIRKPFKEEIILEEIKKHLHASYRYADDALVDNGPVPEISSETLAVLPAGLIEKMTAATKGGYREELLQLIENVEAIDQPAAEALRQLADDCDYDRLIDLFRTSDIEQL